MLLTEEHVIPCRKKDKLFKEIDDYCFRSKNLRNSVTYIIKQCAHISRKLKKDILLTEKEAQMLDKINKALSLYNEVSTSKTKLKVIDENNDFINNAYFLSWYFKNEEVYKEMPYSTCAQICIQEVCRDWKSYYNGLAAYEKKPEKMLGRPKKPRYLDKKNGRNTLVLTSQKVSIQKNGYLKFPKFLKDLKIRTRQASLNQVRIEIHKGNIRVLIQYEITEAEKTESVLRMAIDPGVNNLMTICFEDSTTPVIINGKILKSINQYYNKKRAELQSQAKQLNNRYNTNAIKQLTERRNRKVKDYLHKASRKVVELAQKHHIGTIIIGHNQGIKQDSKLDSKKAKQNFINIPHTMLYQMIQYKAALVGIEVKIIREPYTSGTSYLDCEEPIKEYYDKSRRITRGQFISNKGFVINADINAAYQIMKRAGGNPVPLKPIEPVTILQVI